MTMTDELVKRLLNAPADGLGTENLCLEAADRIEALTAQLESTLKDRAQIIAERDRTYALMLARAEKAEADSARLREVVLEADKLLCGDLTGLQWKRECRSFLVWARAVLKGESHE
jgi:hypothetical protein